MWHWASQLIFLIVICLGYTMRELNKENFEVLFCLTFSNFSKILFGVRVEAVVLNIFNKESMGVNLI